jgi:RNA polymerase sigma factor (sigma-70 family)
MCFNGKLKRDESLHPLKKDKKQKELENLVKACQKNDRLAQSTFFKMYSGKFMGIAIRFSGNQDSANDIIQEAFIRIFTHINDYQFNGSFEGWMRKIVVRCAIDFLKKHNKLIMEDIHSDYSEAIAEHPSSIENMNCEAIVDEITHLPEGYRSILNLYAIEGYSYSEIADMLQIKEASVRSQYMRAKNKLALALHKKNIAHYAKKII